MMEPKLRFPEFEGDWEEKLMGEVGSFKKGSTLSKADLSVEGRPCILYGELYTTYGPVIRDVVSRTEKKLNNSVYGQKNDVLVPASGETAEDIATASSLQVDEVLLGGDINIFTPKKDNGSFISYQLNSSRKKQIVRWSQGASVVHIYKDSLSKLKLRMPSVKEQNKISNLLTLMDIVIDAQQQKVESLKEQKKGLLQKIFKQEIRFKSEGENEFPKWNHVTLNKVARKITEKNKKKITNVISNSASRGLVKQRDYFDKDIANVENVGGYYLVKRGNFVYNPRISREAPFGPVRMYTFDDIGVVSPLYLVFEVASDDIEEQYLKLYFQSSEWHQHIYSFGDQGARHDRVSIKDREFFKLPVPIPHIEEQRKTVALFDALEKKVVLEEQKLALLQEQKKGLMQQMFI